MRVKILRRPAGVLLLSLIVFALLALPRPVGSAPLPEEPPAAAIQPAGPWQASYWNNRKLTGPPVLEREEPALHYNWGEDPPADGVNADDWSARWEATFELSAGRYRLSAQSDDGVRVYLNGRKVIDGWWDHGPQVFQRELELTAGSYEVRVVYYDRNNWAKMIFGLERLAEAQLEERPRSADAPPPTATPTATATPVPPPPAPPEAAKPEAVPPARISAPRNALVKWQGEYFANPHLSGSPALVRQDEGVNFDWGLGAPAPGLPADQFSVRWTASQMFVEGRHKFTVKSDDGVRVYLDGVRIIDEWRPIPNDTFERWVHISKGWHEVRVEYFEDKIYAQIELRITPPDPFADKGNLITCAPPNPPNYAWIRVYRRDGNNEWYRAFPKGIGAFQPSGFIKLDGLPVDINRFGPKGEPYRIERWIDGRLANSAGHIENGDPEFRIRPNTDNHTSWPCPG